MMNAATIGTFIWDGNKYEIDWPFDIDDGTTRSDFGAIYLDGQQVGEVCAPPGKWFESDDDVMEAAIEAIMAGEVDS